MRYEIDFAALTTQAEPVGTRTLIIETSHPLNTGKMAFKRMCVEYARTTGLKCSYVSITEIRESVSR